MHAPTRFSRHSRSRLVHVVCAVLLAAGVSSLAVASDDGPIRRSADPSQLSTPKTRVLSDGGLVEASPIDDAAGIPEAISGGFVYVPINPYRTMDTRIVGGDPLAGGNAEYFTVLTDMDDVQRIPVEAVAVTYNLTVAQTVGSGYIAIYPADIDWPGTSAINWSTSGVAIANGGTIALGDFQETVGAVEILLNPPGSSAHYILDITGYYS